MTTGPYDDYRSKPYEDIRRADSLLNDEPVSASDVAKAVALLKLAQVKMLGRGRL